MSYIIITNDVCELLSDNVHNTCIDTCIVIHVYLLLQLLMTFACKHVLYM